MPRKLTPCVKCGKMHRNPKFCSRSCSASVNNAKDPQRGPKKKRRPDCIDCGAECTHHQGKRCLACDMKARTERAHAQIIESGKHTKGRMLEMGAAKGEARNRHSGIRSHCHRKIEMEGWGKSACECCGYDKHVQLCHVTAIADFPDSATLDEINSRENILFLCPNCHWELDHGLDPMNTHGRTRTCNGLSTTA